MSKIVISIELFQNSIGEGGWGGGGGVAKLNT